MHYYPSGSIINNRYEVVQGPKEKESLMGGMGLVYLCADQAEEGRPVAIKTFQHKYLASKAMKDSFKREALALFFYSELVISADHSLD